MKETFKNDYKNYTKCASVELKGAEIIHSLHPTSFLTQWLQNEHFYRKDQQFHFQQILDQQLYSTWNGIRSSFSFLQNRIFQVNKTYKK